MPRLSPPPLSPEVSRPLLAVAGRIAEVAPWEFMSDLELLGLRDEPAGNLYVASILGTLGTIFAVIVYRHDAGLRWIHELATSRTEKEPLMALEDMDYLKIEWCRKKELQQNDLQTLAAAGYKPKGTGAVWPRFESARPGWHPWGMTDAEAPLMTELLRKVVRFVNLRETSPPLHHEPLEAVIPIIPAGEEFTLRPEQIEWLPFVPRPAPPPEPVTFSAQEQDSVSRLPVRREFVLEMLAPLTGVLAFVDERAGQPCLARVPFMVDRASASVLGTRMAHGAAPLSEAVGPALLEGLRKARARPASIHVDSPRLAAALRPACEAIGVTVREVPLQVAPSVWAEFEEYFRHQRPR